MNAFPNTDINKSQAPCLHGRKICTNTYYHSSRGVLPTVARRVWSRNLENEEAKARYRAVKVQPQWVVTPVKQTSKLARIIF